MAWIEADRVKIRDALGFSAIFLQADPRLENAISSIQALADGGTRPDNTTELAIRGYLALLDQIHLNLSKLWSKALATQVDEIKIDCLRGMYLLRAEGRRIVQRIAVAMATHPRYDIFSSPEYNPEGTPWPHMEASRVEGGAEE